MTKHKKSKLNKSMNNQKTLIVIALLVGSGIVGWMASSSYYEVNPNEYPKPAVESDLGELK
jgi:hypothetical protein